jgi:4'-phosphopantetheinyl transferase EntD
MASRAPGPAVTQSIVLTAYDDFLMIDELLPGTVSAVEAFTDPPGAFLFPEEEAVVRNAVDKRRREFTTARVCARAALAKLGYPAAPILPGPRGAPGWPAGVVGSMTHCAGYRAAAVARADEMHTIGIDAEVHDRLPDGVLGAVADTIEQEALSRLPAGVHWDRLLFSAKESVYKAWFPLAGRWLDFSEARVTVRLDGTFAARLLVPGPTVAGTELTAFNGRWLVRDGLALTVITLSSRS